MNWDTGTSNVQNSAAGSFSFAHVVGGGANPVLWAFFFNGGSNIVLPGAPTYNGVALSQILLLNMSPLFANLYGYRLINPTPGSNLLAGTVSPNSTWHIAVISATGVDQTTPNDSPDTDDSGNHVSSCSGSTPSAVGDEVVDIVGANVAATGGFTAGGGQTVLLTPSTDPVIAGLGISRKAGAALVTQSWDFSPSSGDVGFYHVQMNVNTDTPPPPPADWNLRPRQNRPAPFKPGFAR